MKNIYLINFYKKNREEKIKKYEDFLGSLNYENIKLAIINEGELIKNPDGIILSGSQKMVGDGELDLDYLKYIFSFEKPTLGICYGHQALSRYFGAEVKKAKREHKGFERIILVQNSGLFENFPKQFDMYESHFEEVITGDIFLKNFRILAINNENGIEALEHKSFPFFGVQFHPEESGEYGKMIFENFFNLL